MSDEYQRKLHAALDQLRECVDFIQAHLVLDIRVPELPPLPDLGPSSADGVPPAVSPAGAVYSGEDDGPRYVPWRCPTDCECRAVAAPAPESHACNPGERECNCEQSLGLLETFARFVYYNFGGWLTNDVDRARWADMRFVPEDVRARVESYHEHRLATGKLPDWIQR